MGLSDEALSAILPDAIAACEEPSPRSLAAVRTLGNFFNVATPAVVASLLARAQQAEADAAQLRAALKATMQRATGYDWNADPDNITLLQGEALHA